MRLCFFLTFACCLALSSRPAFSQNAAQKTPLIHVSRGQVPNDSGMGGTRWTIEQDSQLGGPALKVVYAQGDSFGMNRAGTRNWNGFRAIQFDVFNPTQRRVRLELNVKHRGTTDFRSRVVVPLNLKLGKSSIEIKLRDLRNVNGSVPDLSMINHWCFHSPDSAPTLYFGDIWLSGGESVTTPPAPPATGDLKSDPARLQRIRSAKMPKITKPVEFYTPEADAMLTALEVFPPDNAWNTLVEDWPVHPNSKNIVASIGDNKPLRYNTDMSFILAPPNQPRVNVDIVLYPDESDPGPYPVPNNTPIEGWPGHARPPQSLHSVQMDSSHRGGDRHAIVVDPTNRMLYEFYQMKRTARGWQASQASIWDLKSNKLRPERWTSADAAGLPIFPAVIRYDELRRGVIDHAMRVTVRTRAYHGHLYGEEHCRVWSSHAAL